MAVVGLLAMICSIGGLEVFAVGAWQARLRAHPRRAEAMSWWMRWLW